MLLGRCGGPPDHAPIPGTDVGDWDEIGDATLTPSSSAHQTVTDSPVSSVPATSHVPYSSTLQQLYSTARAGSGPASAVPGGAADGLSGYQPPVGRVRRGHGYGNVQAVEDIGTDEILAGLADSAAVAAPAGAGNRAEVATCAVCGGVSRVAAERSTVRPCAVSLWWFLAVCRGGWVLVVVCSRSLRAVADTTSCVQQVIACSS